MNTIPKKFIETKFAPMKARACKPTERYTMNTTEKFVIYFDQRSGKETYYYHRNRNTIKERSSDWIMMSNGEWREVRMFIDTFMKEGKNWIWMSTVSREHEYDPKTCVLKSEMYVKSERDPITGELVYYNEDNKKQDLSHLRSKWNPDSKEKPQEIDEDLKSKAKVLF